MSTSTSSQRKRTEPVASRRERPRLRLLFDELLPFRVARALNELGFRASYVGNQDHGQPRRGSSDKDVLRHAMSTGQIVVTSNHDMIILCHEQEQSVIWIDPHGRQYRHDELAASAFAGIAQWERLLSEATDPVCVRVLRTKVEIMPLARAASLSERRMRQIGARSAHELGPEDTSTVSSNQGCELRCWLTGRPCCTPRGPGLCRRGCGASAGKALAAPGERRPVREGRTR